MKKKAAIVFILIFVILFGGLYFSYTKIIIPKDRIVVDINKEYEEYIELINGEQAEQTITDHISSYVTIDFPFLVTRYNDQLKCKVTYPDLQSYWVENQEELLKLDEEQLKSKLIEACENVNKKTVTITFPAKYDNGFLLLDSDCFEYQDAVSGGLLELAAERYSELLDEMYAEVEE